MRPRVSSFLIQQVRFIKERNWRQVRSKNKSRISYVNERTGETARSVRECYAIERQRDSSDVREDYHILDRMAIAEALRGKQRLVISLDSAGIHVRRIVSTVHNIGTGEVHYDTKPIGSVPVQEGFRELLSYLLTSS